MGYLAFFLFRDFNLMEFFLDFSPRIFFKNLLGLAFFFVGWEIPQKVTSVDFLVGLISKKNGSSIHNNFEFEIKENL